MTLKCRLKRCVILEDTRELTIMNKEKEEEDHLDKMLQCIKKVETPEFLFTKITAKINREIEEFIPMKYVWVTTFSLVVLLVLNIWTIQETKTQTNDTITVVVEGMDMMPNNSFY